MPLFQETLPKKNIHSQTNQRLSIMPLKWNIPMKMIRIPIRLSRTYLTVLCSFIQSDKAFAPMSGRYLGDQDAIKAAIAGVANQTGKK
jgi:hypothetical protein